MDGDFNTHGFLGESAENLRQENICGSPCTQELVSEVNTFLLELRERLIIPADTEKGMLYPCVALLYVRLIRTFESTIILTRSGLHSDAKMLGRGLLESLFKIKAFCNKPKMLEWYWEDEIEKKLRVYKELDKQFNKDKDWHESDKKWERIRTSIREFKMARSRILNKSKRKTMRNMTTLVYAQKAKMLRDYNTNYAGWSMEVHSTVSSIIYDQFVENKTNGIITTKWELENPPTDVFVSHICHYATDAMEAVSKLFRIDFQEELSKLQLLTHVCLKEAQGSTTR